MTDDAETIRALTEKDPDGWTRTDEIRYRIDNLCEAAYAFQEDMSEKNAAHERAMQAQLEGAFAGMLGAVEAEKAALQRKLAETEKALGMFKALFTKWLAEERASVDAAIAAAKEPTDAD